MVVPGSATVSAASLLRDNVGSTMIAELANGPVHAIVAELDPGFGALERAVRGLREAAGGTTLDNEVAMRLKW